MQPYTNRPDLDRLAGKLFRQSARFEYALKAAGFHNEQDGDAWLDWDKFARSVEHALAGLQSNELCVAIDYLTSHPPKKQVVRNGLLEWDSAIPSARSKVELVLLYVRRV